MDTNVRDELAQLGRDLKEHPVPFVFTALATTVFMASFMIGIGGAIPIVIVLWRWALS